MKHMALQSMKTLALWLIPTPLVIVFVAVLIRRQQGAVEPASWVTVSLFVIGGYVVFAFCCLLVMRRQFQGKQGRKLRAKGIEPEAFLELLGAVLFLSPSCCALFLLFGGLPLVHLYASAVFSILGMFCWVGWCRSQKEQHKTKA